MTANELAKRLGATPLNNKLRHPDTGVVLARMGETDFVLTPEGEEVAANLPAKTPRASKAAAVESPEAASVEAPQSDAPTE
jgi:hypothetical protein